MELSNIITIPDNLQGGIYQTGSSVICDPPVIDTDIDYVIWAKDIDELHNFLLNNEFSYSCQDEEEYDMESEGFRCYRKDNINLIVTEDRDWYLKFVLATKLAKKLNLLNKENRVTLFRFVLYGQII